MVVSSSGSEELDDEANDKKRYCSKEDLDELRTEVNKKLKVHSTDMAAFKIE
jgi:hypothetical protein